MALMACDREELNYVREYSKSVKTDLPENLPFHIEPGDMKYAAVLVALFWGADERWHVVLTKRAETLSTHPGENAFPGGKKDPTDADLQETALREAYEEVALPPSDVNIIGKLEPTMTRFKASVTPYIGIIGIESIGRLKGNPAEVSEIFSAPLEIFLSRNTFQYYDYTRSSDPHYSLRYYDFCYQGHRIQGLTASICVKVATLIYNREPEFEFSYPFHVIYLNKL